MDTCPFCGTEIRHETARMGGSCPKCLARIPGEDAPTELGAVDPVAASPGRRGWAYGLLAAMLIGGVGGATWQLSGWWSRGPSPEELVMDAPEMELPAVISVASQRRAHGGRRASAPDADDGPEARGAALDLTVDGPRLTRAGLPQGAEARRQIAGHLTSMLPELSHCYDRRLKQNPDAGGRFRLVLAVTQGGEVDDVRVEALEAEDRTLQACLVHHVQSRWSFEPVAQRSVVSRTVTFRPPAP